LALRDEVRSASRTRTSPFAGRKKGLASALAKDSNVLTSAFTGRTKELNLIDGSRVGVIGGGPAGAFFAYFALRLAESIGLEIGVDIYEPRFFDHLGPAGCNHCGGIVSESLVQLLATEGITLPPTVVRRGIQSYVLHTDVGDVSIETPTHEQRIAAVYRGNGPRRSEPTEIMGFDRYLLDLAKSSGANVVRKLVKNIAWQDGQPQIVTVDGISTDYDLVAVGVGVNSQALNLLSNATAEYESPHTLRAFISEFHLGREAVEACLGPSMHVFLLDLPRLEFAALIPKGDFITLCLIGEDIDDELVQSFLDAPEVRRCFPNAVVPPLACHCFPRINVKAAVRPYGDRIVWVGDCGASRLFKDGIGSAYRTAKAAARTAVFNGISSRDFKEHFWPECARLDFDNSIAKVIFTFTKVIQKARFLRRGVLRMTAREQSRAGRRRHMSRALWDVFTGSAPYREVLLRTFHPEFPAQLFWNLIASNLASARLGKG